MLSWFRQRVKLGAVGWVRDSFDEKEEIIHNHKFENTCSRQQRKGSTGGELAIVKDVRENKAVAGIIQSGLFVRPPGGIKTPNPARSRDPPKKRDK